VTIHRACILLIFLITAVISPVSLIAQPQPLTWGFAVDGYPVTAAQLSTIEASTGLCPDMFVFFLQWPAPDAQTSGQFPAESVAAISTAGATPVITWEPMYFKDGKEVSIAHQTLLTGKYDNYILRFANGAKAYKKTIMIRFAHEMNLKRYHWGTTEKEYGPESPAIYQKMHRYVVDLFRRAGADNVLWVFCPNAESVPNTSFDPNAGWNTISRYYPGDAYADVLGADGYNWGTTRKKQTHGWESRWMSFRDIFTKPVAELKKLDKGNAKPVMVFETSTAAVGGNKKEWIADAIRDAPALGIVGIAWFQSNKETDWRIESGTDKDYVKIICNARKKPPCARPAPNKMADRYRCLRSGYPSRCPDIKV
jgi:mannan endo-1,4-beta-mannosidase